MPRHFDHTISFTGMTLLTPLCWSPLLFWSHEVHFWPHFWLPSSVILSRVCWLLSSAPLVPVTAHTQRTPSSGVPSLGCHSALYPAWMHHSVPPLLPPAPSHSVTAPSLHPLSWECGTHPLPPSYSQCIFWGASIRLLLLNLLRMPQ